MVKDDYAELRRCVARAEDAACAGRHLDAIEALERVEAVAGAVAKALRRGLVTAPEIVSAPAVPSSGGGGHKRELTGVDDRQSRTTVTEYDTFR